MGPYYDMKRYPIYYHGATLEKCDFNFDNIIIIVKVVKVNYAFITVF